MNGDTAASLRDLARQCRCLAVGAGTAATAASLGAMAASYDRQADRADRAEARTRERLNGPLPPFGDSR